MREQLSQKATLAYPKDGGLMNENGASSRNTQPLDFLVVSQRKPHLFFRNA